MALGQMKKLAKMFGVELGEWFRLRRVIDQKYLNGTYVFDENGFWGKTENRKRCYNVEASTWQFLLTGDYEVVKIERERCYIVTFRQCKPLLLDKEMVVFAKSAREAVDRAVKSAHPMDIVRAESQGVYADEAMYCKHCDKAWAIKADGPYKYCPDCGCRLKEWENE